MSDENGLAIFCVGDGYLVLEYSDNAGLSIDDLRGASTDSTNFTGLFYSSSFDQRATSRSFFLLKFSYRGTGFTLYLWYSTRL